MTEEKHVRILYSTFRRWFPDISESDAMGYSKGAVNRFMVAMDLEMEETEQGIVEEALPRTGLPRHEAERLASPQPMEEKLPPPPVNVPGASLIIAPDSAAGKETMESARVKPKIALRLPTRKPMAVPVGPRKYWTESSLRDFVETNTPPILDVATDDRAEPVVLIRNIEVQLGCDTVKLSYGVAGALAPTPSQQNEGGAVLAATSVDTPVYDLFECTEQHPDMDAHMKVIREKARSFFRPKPDHLDSYTPRRTGALTYRLADPRMRNDPRANPHDETDVLRNSRGEEY